MDAIEAIKTRRSIRAYENRPISREILMDLVDCARLAPTAMNQQLWEFVVVTDPEMRSRLARIIGHAAWFAQCPAGIAVISKVADYWKEDASAATQNILLAARAHGLGSCWIAGEGQAYADAARDALGASAQYRFFCLVALGYPAEDPRPDKRNLDATLHWEHFKAAT